MQMAMRVWVELSPTVMSLQNRRSRGHPLFRCLGGFCGWESERARIKGLGWESKEVWKVE